MRQNKFAEEDFDFDVTKYRNLSPISRLDIKNQLTFLNWGAKIGCMKP